jgi:hypothetical protein
MHLNHWAARSVATASLLIGSYASAAPILTDTFSYADGPIVAPGSPWASHSGTAGQVDVASGVVNVSQAESEDVNTPFSAFTTGTVYAGLDFNLSVLPAGTGNYFAHFKDTATGFRGRVFATTTDAAAGSYRLAIADTTATFVTIPVDLALNTTHRFVVASDAATGRSTLYLDSATETGGTVATDTTSALAAGISGFALRQSTASGAGMGVLTADNLSVATTYAEAFAVPEPTSMAAVGLGAIALLRRRRSR